MRGRTFLAAAIAATLRPVRAADPLQEMAGDIEGLWKAIDSRYAYFDEARRKRYACRRLIG